MSQIQQTWHVQPNPKLNSAKNNPSTFKSTVKAVKIRNQHGDPFQNALRKPLLYEIQNFVCQKLP